MVRQVFLPLDGCFAHAGVGFRRVETVVVSPASSAVRLRPALHTDQMGDPRSHKINRNRGRVGEVGKRLEAGVAL